MQSESVDLLRQLIMGFRNTQLVYVAAKLGLADRLAECPKTALELAQEVGAHPGAAYRILRALTSLGIVAEASDGKFSLTACGELLRSNVPGSMRNMALLYGDEWVWRAYGRMLHSVRTGKPAFPEIHGLSFYDFLNEHSEAGIAFQAAMDDFSNVESAAILRACDFSGFHSIVDVGSGRGVLLAAILQAHPNVHGIAFDIPSVEPECAGRLQSAGLTRRSTFVGGDFFRELPAAHSVYLLKSVLHNWDDTAAARILNVCRQAMSAGSRLLIIERVISHGQQSAEGKLFDVNMLVTVGGQERTEKEYRSLLVQEGFTWLRTIPTDSAMTIIEATSHQNEERCS